VSPISRHSLQPWPLGVTLRMVSRCLQLGIGEPFLTKCFYFLRHTCLGNKMIDPSSGQYLVAQASVGKCLYHFFLEEFLREAHLDCAGIVQQ
jgi:hypothetical protein